jgi:imidazolonepropionase-like amidohydrolase
MYKCLKVGFLLGVLLSMPRSAFTNLFAEGPLVITGGRLIDGFGGAPLENAVVVIDGGQIVQVGQVGKLDIPPASKMLSAEGMTLLPGLWESHGHLHNFGSGFPPNVFREKFPDRFKEVMSRVAEITLRAGITSLRDLGGTLKLQKEIRSDIESGKILGPTYYIAGPTLMERGKNDMPSASKIGSQEEGRDAVKRLADQGVDLISVDGFWSLEILQAITRKAHELGLGVDAGVRHIKAYRIALQAGVDRLHTVFTTDPLSDYSNEELRLLVRGESPLASGPSANILRGPYILPAMEIRQAYVRAFDFPESLEHPRFREQFPPDIYRFLRETWKQPSSIPWGLGARQRVEVVKRKIARFIRAGGREQLVPGTDAGSPLNFHSPIPREIANLVEAGLTPMEAIQSATLRAAQMQGVEDRVGTVSVGKVADILVVDGDPLHDITLLQHGVVHVIKNGVLVPEN